MLFDNIVQAGCCVGHIVVKVVWDATVAWDGFIERLEKRH